MPISCVNLVKQFGKKTAINDVSLKLNKGDIIGLVGPDGAGKTTLIRMLASVLAPTSGEVYIDGCSIQKEQVLGKIGYVSQQFGLYKDLTVLENLEFFADLYGLKRADKEKKISELLKFSQLERFKDFQADQLSGGMKQKLSLSCALIHDPPILLLDEPTNGVDPMSRRDFWTILWELKAKGTTILLATAYLEEAERCSHIIFIYEGKVLAEGTLEELQSHLKGDIIEVKCQAPRKALLALKENFGFDEVKLFGNRIHIFLFTEHSQNSVFKVEEILLKMKLDDYSIRVTPPTLEDVFMTLMRDHEMSHER